MCIRSLYFLASLAVLPVLPGCGYPTSAFALSSLPASGAAKSWIDADAKRGGLLYVSQDADQVVDIYSYPGAKLAGQLTGFSAPQGMCSDDTGNVYVTDGGNSDVDVYTHGGTSPIAVLNDAGYVPSDCAFDKSTGNLAVTNYTALSGQGNVAIYAGARGYPAFYSGAEMYGYWACAYDNNGNLFVTDLNGYPSFAELPKGSGTFVNLTLPFKTPGGLAWDGAYLAAETTNFNAGESSIYRLEVSGSSVTVKGIVRLGRGHRRVEVNYFWVGRGNVAATARDNHVGIWRYPSARQPLQYLKKVYSAQGVTVSFPSS